MIGTVLGTLCPSGGLQQIREQRWVQVSAGGMMLAAADLAGCKKGDTVLVLSGDAAGRLCMGCCCDWAVAAVLGETGNNG